MTEPQPVAPIVGAIAALERNVIRDEMLTPLMSASQIRGFIRKPFQFVNLTQILRNAILT